MSCACDFKVMIYVDGGQIFEIVPLQKIGCHSVDECLFCISMEAVFDRPEDHVFGVYKGICHNAINGPDYFGEYDGEGWVYDVKKLKIKTIIWRILITFKNFFYKAGEKNG